MDKHRAGRMGKHVTNRKSPERRGRVQLVDARELWQKMRKSLGAKRKELSADHIAEITKLYGAFEDGDRVKILPNEALGFLRITVERPLRLRWGISPETLDAVRAERRFAKLAPEAIDHLVATLAERSGLTGTDRRGLAKTVDPILRTAGLTAAQQKAVWDALAVRDPDAQVLTNRRDEPEPRPRAARPGERRPPRGARRRRGGPEPPAPVDRVPRRRRGPPRHRGLSVCPRRLVDQSRTKIGYEIPLTRHFYRYVPPRPLEEIDAEIKQLEAEIQDLLREVTE